MIADMYHMTKSADYPIRDLVSFQYKAVSGIEYFCDAMSRWIKIDRIVNDKLLRQRDSGAINGSAALFVCFLVTCRKNDTPCYEGHDWRRQCGVSYRVSCTGTLWHSFARCGRFRPCTGSVIRKGRKCVFSFVGPGGYRPAHTGQRYFPPYYAYLIVKMYIFGAHTLFALSFLF